MSDNLIVRLTGAVNGINKEFDTPSAFDAGSFRLILNGQVYEPDDMKWGWSEVSDSRVLLVNAPRTGDEVQGFYQVKGTGGSGADVVIGSPFDPNGLIP